MQLNAVNSTVLQPPVFTEAGAPIMGPNPIQSVTVSPTFNLPENGQRPEDKHPKNKNPYAKKSEEKEIQDDVLPESFKLILGPDFSEIFKAFFDAHTVRLAEAQRLFRLSNGMKENMVYSKMYQKMPGTRIKRETVMKSVLMYHYNRPGSRFVGSM